MKKILFIWILNICFYGAAIAGPLLNIQKKPVSLGNGEHTFVDISVDANFYGHCLQNNGFGDFFVNGKNRIFECTYLLMNEQEYSDLLSQIDFIPKEVHMPRKDSRIDLKEHQDIYPDPKKNDEFVSMYSKGQFSIEYKTKAGEGTVDLGANGSRKRLYPHPGLYIDLTIVCRPNGKSIDFSKPHLYCSDSLLRKFAQKDFLGDSILTLLIFDESKITKPQAGVVSSGGGTCSTYPDGVAHSCQAATWQCEYNGGETTTNCGYKPISQTLCLDTGFCYQKPIASCGGRPNCIVQPLIK
jgi:hypothetical protein